MSDEQADPRSDGGIDREQLIRFFSVLSHDLKSPIFSIDGFSDLLVSDYADKLDDDARDFLARIRSAAHNMKGVLDDMMHMVKLLSRPNDPRPVEFQSILEEVRLRCGSLLEEGGVQVEVPDSLPVLKVDPEKFREAFTAVFENAVVFNDRPVGERKVRIEHSREGNFDSLCVIDNGIGMDPRYVQQVFELGLKLDKARGGGPGYSLYMAREVIASHGGELTVETSPDEGSRFCFRIPA